MNYSPHGYNPYPEYPHGYGGAEGQYQLPDYEQYNRPYAHQFMQPPTAPSGSPRVRPRVGIAITYGFKAVLANPLLWIVGTLIYIFVVHGPTAFFSPSLADILSGAYLTHTMSFSNFWNATAVLLFSPIAFTAALLQLDGVPVTIDSIKAKLNYPQALLTNLLMNVIMYGCFLGMVTLAALSLSYVTDNGGLASLIMTGIVGMVLIILTYLICMALFSFSLPLAVDGRAFNLAALKQSIYFGRRVFGPLVGFHLLAGLILLLGMAVTCGFASVILMPMVLHSSVHIYRQAIGAYYLEV